MKPGAVLVIECPDFDAAVVDYINGNENRINNIFGYQRYPGDAHLFGYNFKRLKSILENTGFESVIRKEPTDNHALEEPCMRVECVRK